VRLYRLGEKGSLVPQTRGSCPTNKGISCTNILKSARITNVLICLWYLHFLRTHNLDFPLFIYYAWSDTNDSHFKIDIFILRTQNLDFPLFIMLRVPRSEINDKEMKHSYYSSFIYYYVSFFKCLFCILIFFFIYYYVSF